MGLVGICHHFAVERTSRIGSVLDTGSHLVAESLDLGFDPAAADVIISETRRGGAQRFFELLGFEGTPDSLEPRSEYASSVPFPYSFMGDPRMLNSFAATAAGGLMLRPDILPELTEYVAFSEAYYDMFRAKDGFVIIGCMDPKAFEVLCKTIGREELLKDPRFMDWRKRSRYKAELNSIITEWTLQHGKEEIMHLLLEKGRIVASVITEVEDIINNEDLRRLGVMQKVEYQDLGEMWVPAMPCLSSEIKIEAEPPRAVGAAEVL